LREVKAPTLLRQTANRWRKVVSPTRRPHFVPRFLYFFLKIPDTHFSLVCWIVSDICGTDCLIYTTFCELVLLVIKLHLLAEYCQGRGKFLFTTQSTLITTKYLLTLNKPQAGNFPVKAQFQVRISTLCEFPKFRNCPVEHFATRYIRPRFNDLSIGF
jgi:hypothetical protein